MASAKVDVDDKDGAAKLAAMNAKLATLGERTSRPKITVAGAARAQAEVAALDAEMDRGEEKAVGLKSRLLALGSGASVIGGLGDVFGAFNSEASMASRVMSGFGAATGLLEAPLAGLVVGVGGLASGLVAAGAGMLAFGAVAKANMTAATTAANAVQAAQVSYNAAITHGAKQAAAYRTEQVAIAKAYAQLSPAQIALSKQIGTAQNAWQSFVQANTSGVAKVMTQGIGLLPKVFASLQPFMAPVEKALSGLVGQLGKGLDSSGFKSFITLLAGNSGPAITKIGQAIGHVAVGIGGVIRSFMPFAQVMLSGLDKITAKFATWGSTLTQHSGFKSLTSMAKQDMPMVIEVVKNLGGAIVRVVSAMTGLSTASNSSSLLKLAVPLSQFVNWLSKANPELLNMGLYALSAGGAVGKMKPLFAGAGAAIGWVKGARSGLQDLQAGFSNSAAAASGATGIWGTLGGKIATAVTAVKGWAIWSKIAAAGTKIWTGIQAAFDVVMSANPIVLVVIAIAALVGAIVLITMHSKAFRDFWKKAWHDIASVFDTVRHAIAKGFDFITHAASEAFGWVKGHWPLLLAILTGPIGLAVLFIVDHWHQITAGAARMFRDVVSFFRSLPSRILSVLGNLGNLLWNAGAAIIRGLLGGLKAGWNDVTGFVGGIGSWISSHKGPIEADQVLLKPHGRAIMKGLVSGLQTGMPDLGAQLQRTTAAISGGVRPGSGGGSGGGGRLDVYLHFQPTGNKVMDAIVDGLKVEIRGKGGGGPHSVQKALGRTWLAG